MTETMLQTIPIMRIFDVDKAREFYVGSTVFVRIQGIDEYHREVTSKGYGYMRPGVDVAPWNAKVMEVIDPFGNRLRFNEDLPRDAPARVG